MARLLIVFTITTAAFCYTDGAVCDGDEFKCKISGICLPPGWRCDDNVDCSDRISGIEDTSDEIGCRNRTCLVDQFTCDDGICIKGIFRCDGNFQCSDQSDEKYCNERPWVIFSTRTNIWGIRTDMSDLKPLARTNNSISLDYDFKNKMLYWSEVTLDAIFRAHIHDNHTLGSSEKIIYDHIKNVDGISVDWVYGHIYWTDNILKEIGVAKLNGSMQTTLINKDLDEPRGIAVDPNEGWLFFSDWGSYPKIERISMDGDASSREIIVNDKIRWPNGLSIDFVVKRIYWTDAEFDTISLIQYDGKGRRIVLQNIEKLAHPFGIAVFKDDVYWSDWKSNTINLANKIIGENLTTIFHGTRMPFGVKVYHKTVQLQRYQHCGSNNGDCSHLCLPRPNIYRYNQGKHYSCVCPRYFILNAQGKTCIKNVSPATEITATSIVETTTTTPPVPQRSDISCDADTIDTFVPISMLPSGAPLTWRDPSCKVTSNGTHMISSIGHNQCGTTVTITKDTVEFENELTAQISNHSSNTLIDFGENSYVIPVKCIYPRTETPMTSYVPLQQHVRFYEKRYGHFDVDITQYDSDKFSSAIQGLGVPRKVALNSEIFVEVKMNDQFNNGLGIHVDKCIATPSPSPSDSTYYNLLTDGCPASQHVQLYNAPANKVRFGVRAFQFTSHNSSIVYIHCQTSMCEVGTPYCVSNCVTAGRRKRDVAPDQKSHLVSTGPFVFVADEQDNPIRMSTIVASVSLFVAVVACVAAVMGWTRKKTHKCTKEEGLL